MASLSKCTTSFLIYFSKILLLIPIIFNSCNSDGNQEGDFSKIDQLMVEYQKDGSRELADSIALGFISNPQFFKNKKDNALKALKITAQQHMKERNRQLYIRYLLELDKGELPEGLLNVADILQNEMGNHKISSFIYLTFIEEYHADSRWDSILTLVPEDWTTTEDIISESKKNIFAPDGSLLSRVNADDFMQFSELYALSKPDNAKSPDFLFEATEVATALEYWNRSSFNTQWIVDRYPDHEAAPRAMFFQAFTLDESGRDPDQAATLYNKFIQSYPDHEFAESAKVLRDNLGLSDSELMEKLKE